MQWIVYIAIGLVPWVLALACLWRVRGYSPRRLLWPDLSSIKTAAAARDRLVVPRMRANKAFYGPLFLGAIVAGGYLLAAGYDWGVTVFAGLATPSVLAFLATTRSMLLLRRLERR